MQKTIKGTNGKYLINDKGEVYSLLSNVKLKPTVDTSGYVQYKLFISYDAKTKKRKYLYRRAHRLVAEYFIPNPQKYEVVNHIDGNKQNNDISNLEWCSAKYNVHHAFITGLVNIPKKYKDSEIDSILVDFISDKSMTIKDLEDKYQWYIGSNILHSYLLQSAKRLNKEKEYEERCSLIKNNVGKCVKVKLQKAVNQYTYNGTFITKWACINDAAKALHLRQGNITNACSGRTKSCGGYKWSYA